MISKQDFLRLYDTEKQRQYSSSSFACWDANDVGETGFFDSPDQNLLNQLRGDYILVGLNPSKECSGPFKAFHFPHRGGRDTWLRDALKDTKLYGCYITDLYKGFVHSKSQEVENYKSNDPGSVEADLDELFDEIVLLNPNCIVALGKQTFDEIKNLINNGQLFFDLSNVFCLPHYAGRMSKADYLKKTKELIQQLP